jgi:hypothetical protein
MTALSAETFFQPCDDEDAVAPMLDTYRSGQGFIGTDEYEPIGADNALISTHLPFACLVNDPDTHLGVPSGNLDVPPNWESKQGSCEAIFAAPHSQTEHMRFAANMPHAGYLVLRLRTYPAWRVTLNGQPVTEFPEREDGLMTVEVQQGSVEIDADWTTTPDMVAGRWLSALFVLFLAAVYWLERTWKRVRL